MDPENLGESDDTKPDPTVDPASPVTTGDDDVMVDLTGSLVALAGLSTARLSLEDLLTC